MSGKPIPEEAVAQVCDRMLTAAIGKDWRKRAPEAVTAFWMGEVREALQEVVPALTAAQQQGQGQGQGGGEVVAHGFYDPVTGAYSESQHTPRWLPAVVCTAPPSAPVGVRNAILEALNLVHAEGRARVESATAEMADRLAALAQQPAAVDEAMVERALRAWREAVVVHEGNKPAIRAALTAALAAQHQEPKS